MGTVLAATLAGCLSARFAQPPWHDDHPSRLELASRLEPDHLARLLDAVVDRLDLGPVEKAYAGTGSFPHRPDLLLKVVLYERHNGRHSPAQWARNARTSEPLRWLLRGGIPSRSCWYAFRDRCGLFYDELNRQVLDEVARQQLTPGTRAALDGTSIAADASRHRLVNAAALERRQENLAAAVADDEQGRTPPTPQPGWQAKTPSGRSEQQQRLERARQRLEHLRALNRGRGKSKRRPDDKVVVSLSDPEAVLGRDKEGVFRPLYNVQLVRDLDSPFVLGYDVVAQLNDAGVLEPMLKRVQNLSGRQLRELLTDSAYAGGADLAAAQAANVTVYAPWQAHDFSVAAKKKSKQIPKSAFIWQELEQVYECPEGRRLTAEKKGSQARASSAAVQTVVYRCAAEHCAGCPRREQCCPKARAGRTISRSEHEGLLEQLRERMATPEAKELYRLRRQTVELVNADWKGHRQFRRFSGRGLARARCQVGLQVLTHNLVALLAEEAKRAAAKNAPAAPARIPLPVIT
jgi:transposase